MNVNDVSMIFRENDEIGFTRTEEGRKDSFGEDRSRKLKLVLEKLYNMVVSGNAKIMGGWTSL